MPTKAQSRRSSRLSGKYKNQFLITERNKKRRTDIRERKRLRRLEKLKLT